jgi:hypothetical protein
MLLPFMLSACARAPSNMALFDQTTYNLAPHGIVLVLNPANCSFDARTGRALQVVDSVLGGQGTALVYGLSDSTEAARTLKDLGLNLRIHILTDSQRAAIKAALSLPIVALMRSGNVDIVVSGEATNRITSWLPLAAGVNEANFHLSRGKM